MNLKIQVSNKKDSERIQLAWMKLGYRWERGSRKLEFLNKKFLFADSRNNTITYTDSDVSYFNYKKNKEIRLLHPKQAKFLTLIPAHDVRISIQEIKIILINGFYLIEQRKMLNDLLKYKI